MKRTTNRFTYSNHMSFFQHLRIYRNDSTRHKPDSRFVLFQPHLVNCFTLEINIDALINEPETGKGVREEDHENSEEKRAFFRGREHAARIRLSFMKGT